MKKISLPLLALFFVFALSACSKGSESSSSAGSGTGGGGSPQQPPLIACNDVITTELLQEYHARQAEFRLEATGADVDCMEERNINGNVTRVEKHGRSNARLLPNLRFESIAPNPNNDRRAFIVRGFVQVITDADLARIASDLGVSSNPESNPVLNELPSSPSFVRFGKGQLFSLSDFRRGREGDKIIFQFMISPKYASDAQSLARKVAEFGRTQDGLDVLWYPSAGELQRQVFARGTQWSSLAALAVLKSSVRELDGPADREALTNAISNATFWNLDISSVHRELPELYQFADREWQNPTIADNTASELLTELKYLVKISPRHARAEVATTYELVGRFHETIRSALQMAVDYVGGRSYTKEQFGQLVELANTLHKGFSNHSWLLAEKLAERSSYDRAKYTFAAAMGGELGARRLISVQDDANSIVEAIFAKIAAGLNAENAGLYFRAFDGFVESFRAGKEEAASAADRMILSGRVSESTYPLFFQFLGWLKNTAYVQFSDAIDVAASLRAYDAGTTGLFRSVYEWLTGEVYLNRSDALKKAGVFVGLQSFNSESFRLLKDYFSWLTGSIYLNRQDALAKAETAMNAGVSAAAIASIKDLADWYISTIYLNRQDALGRAERLVLTAKITPNEVALLKNVLDWMVNTIYMNRTDAATKAEGLITGSHRLTQELLNQLKEVTDWYINSIYMNRSDAFKKVEGLLFTAGLSREQTGLLKDAATWLIDSVYVNRTEAAAKAEAYLTTNHLTRALYSDLQKEFSRLVDQGKGRAEALRLAEKKILPQ